ACGEKPSSTHVKIFNVTQGLAGYKNGEWKIYQRGDQLELHVNGECSVAGGKKPCMWVAGAFGYEADGERTILTRKAKFSAPTDVVNPKEVKAKDTSEFSWTLELQGRTGKKVIPGYVIPGGNPQPVTTTTDCMLDGKTVLNYSRTVTEPR